MRRSISLAALLLTTGSACVTAPLAFSQAAADAQPTIREVLPQQEWVLSAGEMSYVLGINDKKMLQALYWGPRLADGADAPAGLPPLQMHGEAASFEPAISTTPLEYPGWGGGLSYEPALKISFSDGNRALELTFVSAHVSSSGDELEIVTKDALQPIFTHLFYHLYPQGVLARWSVIENRGEQTVTVEQAASATWNLPRLPDYQLHWLSGRWGGEWQQQQHAIDPGNTVLESRRGSTSHQTNPWFAIDETSATTETAGPVWFGELGWSGSWRINVEKTEAELVRVTGGFNPFDFAYPLAPKHTLTTPKFYGGYTAHGEGEASRILHRFQTQVIAPEGPKPKLRPVLFNSWEATEFDVDEAGQIALADKAAKLGAERLVIDDGWFGQRVTDHAGLGDWYVNEKKFPHGLKPVIDHVHSLGMDFGIWVEPEMVNPDSDLYRKHPDWAMHFPGRPRTEERNQLLLNLAREDVKAYVFHFLDDLVSKNDIAFLKWDYNRNWSEPGWENVPLAEQKTIYVKYVENLYAILDELRKKHPGLEIESCSGGGGRVDLGILRYTDEVWPSDNTDALDRLTIQDGFSYAYSPGLMMAWVTDVPNFMNKRVVPLDFRFMVAMSGSLGIGGNLNKWTDAEMAEATKLTAFYKTVRPTVQQGSLYRLAPELHAKGQWATEYVASDGTQAVIFAYLHSQQYGNQYPVIHPQGLDPKAMYTIKPYDAAKVTGLPQQASGGALMGSGVQVDLHGDYDSTAIVLEKVSR